MTPPGPPLVIGLCVAAAAAVRGLWSPCGLSVLSTLNPVAERARGHRFAPTAAWYVAGALAGGLALGAVAALGALGLARSGLGADGRWWLLLGAAAVAVASDSSAVRWSLPVHPRQLDERWLHRYRRWIYAGGFGLQIGCGVATYIMTAGVYLTAAAAVLTASPGSALLVGVVFGVVRGLTVLVTVPAGTPERLRALLAAVDRRGPLSLRVVLGVSVVAGTVAAAVVGGAPGAVAAATLLTVLGFGPDLRRAAIMWRRPRPDPREAT